MGDAAGAGARPAGPAAPDRAAGLRRARRMRVLERRGASARLESLLPLTAGTLRIGMASLPLGFYFRLMEMAVVAALLTAACFGFTLAANLVGAAAEEGDVSGPGGLTRARCRRARTTPPNSTACGPPDGRRGSAWRSARAYTRLATPSCGPRSAASATTGAARRAPCSARLDAGSGRRCTRSWTPLQRGPAGRRTRARPWASPAWGRPRPTTPPAACWSWRPVTTCGSRPCTSG